MEKVIERTSNPREDDYYEEFYAGCDGYDLLMDEVQDMEANSTWLHGVTSNTLRLSPVDNPITVAEEMAAEGYTVDDDLLMDTMSSDGLKLVVHQTLSGQPVKSWCLRTCSWNSLLNTAKLMGSAFSRMEPYRIAETLNNGLEVARGNSLMLERFGKIAAIHSNQQSGYAIMPISELLRMTHDKAEDQFGSMDFLRGNNSHSYTSCVWTLPAAKDDLLSAYQTALQGLVDPASILELTPAIRFESSDTANSAAKAIPVFLRPSGVEVRFVDGVNIKHEKKGSKDPMEKFSEDVGNLYPMFEDAFTKAAELAQIQIRFPVNCVINLCKRYNIPKRYGEAARYAAEGLMGMNRAATAYDIYSVMSNCLEAAEKWNVNARTMAQLEDSVARVLTCNWAEHDVGGNVAW